MAAPAKPEPVHAEEPAAPEEPPKPARKVDPNLKGGIGGPSGGEKFGLKW